jgi:hypothetical protein
MGKVSVFTKILNVLFFPAKYFYVQGFRLAGDMGLPPALYWVIISVIIGLVWGYLLSCLIIYLFRKIKSK